MDTYENKILVVTRNIKNKTINRKIKILNDNITLTIPHIPQDIKCVCVNSLL